MSFRRSFHRRGLDSTDGSFHRFDPDDTDDPFESAILGFAGRPDHRGDGRGDENNKSLSPLPYDATAFPDGVSSGDVTQTSAVLWARANKPGVVTFQISSDPGFHHVIGSRAVSVADSLVPAKVLIDGLHPDQRYYYRAVDASGTSPEALLKLRQNSDSTRASPSALPETRKARSPRTPRSRMHRPPGSMCSSSWGTFLTPTNYLRLDLPRRRFPSSRSRTTRSTARISASTLGPPCSRPRRFCRYWTTTRSPTILPAAHWRVPIRASPAQAPMSTTPNCTEMG